MSNSFQAIKSLSQSLKLFPISIRELFYLHEAPCDIFSSTPTGFKKKIRKHATINKTVLKTLLKDGCYRLYIDQETRDDLIESTQNRLREVTRSLSIDDPLEKGKTLLNILTINLGHLYRDPTNDEILSLQHQSIKNLCKFLLDRPALHIPIYETFIKQGHHYIYAQPMLSSFFLLGVLSSSPQISPKEIENLFVVSYFKDIGMSAIPEEKYDQKDLSIEDKKTLSLHPENSLKILENRISLSSSALNIIQHHHSFSIISKDLNLYNKEEETDLIQGFETIIVSVIDIISAMISKRPFREKTSVFEALDLVKGHISEQYPQEFRLIVTYFKNFFNKINKG